MKSLFRGLAGLCLCLFATAAAGNLAEETTDPAISIGAPAAFTAGESIRRELAIAENRTLYGILLDNGVPRDEAVSAAQALARAADLRKLRVGQRLTLFLEPLPRPAIGARLIGLALALDGDSVAAAFRGFDDRFASRRMPRAEALAMLESIHVVPDGEAPGFMSRDLRLADGGNLHDLLVEGGAAPGAVASAIRLLRRDVNLRRLPVGQKVTAIFDRAGGGRPARLVGVVLAARGKTHTAGRGGDGRWRLGPPAVGTAPPGASGAPDDTVAETPPPEIPAPPRPAADATARAPGEKPPPSHPRRAASLEARVDGARRAALADAAPRLVSLRAGDTAIGALMRAGFSHADAYAAVMAVGDLHDLRALRAGQAIAYAPAAGAPGAAPSLGAVHIDLDPAWRLSVVRLEDGAFAAGFVEKKLTRAWRRVDGVIGSSLYTALADAGAPIPVVMELIRLFGFSVDLQRDVRPDDRISLIFETFFDDLGHPVKAGDILYASMILSGEPHTLYFHERVDGRAGHFDARGESARKALMRTPIDGARLTSGFGKRRHPLLGYDRMHQGVDFGAPTGTPIYASGDGIVERASFYGDYGRYVRIRHNSAYQTAYAHLRAFAEGLYPGKRVRQGETIGYVGSSGLSTGPHLHYEVIHNGRQVNPLSVALPAGDPLEGPELAVFARNRRALDRAGREWPLGSPVAVGDTDPLAALADRVTLADEL